MAGGKACAFIYFDIHSEYQQNCANLKTKVVKKCDISYLTFLYVNRNCNHVWVDVAWFFNRISVI